MLLREKTGSMNVNKTEFESDLVTAVLSILYFGLELNQEEIASDWPWKILGNNTPEVSTINLIMVLHNMCRRKSYGICTSGNRR